MAGSTAPPFDMKLGGTRVWDDTGEVRDSFSGRSSSQQTDEDTDPEALTWATHEKPQTPYTAILAGSLDVTSDGEGPQQQKHVDVRKLSRNERASILAKAFDTSERDNQKLLQSLKDRIDRVGIELPKVEVRFQDLHISAQVYVGGRALPSLWNFVRNMVEACLAACRLLPSEKCDLQILHGVSGVLKPGRMTLLLGPPGSGKSTLLMALTGKLDSSLRKSGLITYNGLTLNEFVPQRTALYVSQTDNHVGELTVRETLDFAARCQGVGYKKEMMAELVRREKAHQIRPPPGIDAYMKASTVEGKKHSVSTDYIMKILGLEHCADTIVGDQMLRGISGGQKKRVTTGEMVVGPRHTLFMDEISTGLDSSTTFQIVICTRNFVHLHDATVLMALLQPPPETFDLFDDILLLAEGHVVYLGPRENVLEFFESLGFKLPPRKGIADFLQEVTSKKDQAQYWADQTRPYKYIPVSAMAAAFQESEVRKELKAHLATPFDISKSHSLAMAKTKYALSRWKLFKACFERELLLMKRNRFLYVFRTFQVGLVAFLTATLFVRTNLDPTNESDGNLYMNCLFYSLIHMVFNGFSEMSLTVMRLQVFYKQRDNLFYPGWAFSIPVWILRLPYSAVEAVVWSSIVYYTVGLAPDVTRFCRFTLLLFLMHQVSVGIFRTIGALGRSMVIANTLGSFAVRALILLGGFILAKNSMHPWWVWGYWVSPMTYAQNALSVNEFLAPRWQTQSPDAPGVPLYKRILGARGMPMKGYWYWIGVAALIGYTFFLNFTVTLALSYFDSTGKPQAVVTEETLREKTEDTTDHGAGNGAGGLESTNHVVESSLESGGSIELGAVARQNERMPEIHVDIQQLTEPKASRGMILPFKPLALSFHNVCYYVDMPPEMHKEGLKESKLQLLKSVSGAFRPGVLTALVGVSGAGKTTLMDVLAGRKTGGRITGEIRVSGYPKVQATFARVTGYVEQTDIHSPQVTVHESLLYSSWLRLPDDVDTKTRHAFVEEVMELVELAPLRNALVGIPGSTGLSTEQRKRLTIAVELVANPSIIFMDEPTSGLDARAAAIVMRTVRNTVDTGRTVVCTIHQPSIDIFEAFDELLLMERGGTVIYAGPLGQNSQQLIDYFESINGVPPIKDGYNPATWMLEVTTPASEQRIGQGFADIYKKSELFRLNESLIDQLSVPAPGTEYLRFPTEYPRSSATQLVACLWKQHWTYWRSPQYNCVRFAFTVIGSVMFGSMFWGLGSKRRTEQEVFNVVGALYSAVLFLGISNASTVQPIVAVERAVFYRERAAGMYSPFPYALAQGLIEIPYIFLQTLVYTSITYSMMQFEWTAAKFLWHMLFMGLAFAYFTFFGMMAVGLTASQHLAAVISSAFYSVWNLFSGFLIPQPRIPGWWIWYYWICPVAWTLHGLVASQLGDVTTTIENIPGSPTVASFVESYFGYKYDMLVLCAVVLAAFGFLFWFIFALAIKYINFQRR